MGLFDLFRAPKGDFADLVFESDVHCHILCGVDDGFGRIHDSIEALRQYQQRGVKRVYLTPHVNLDSFSDNDEKSLAAHFTLFRQSILEAGIDIDLRLGAEYMINEMLDLERDFLTFSGNRVLIEMSYYYESPNIGDAVFQLNLRGYTPVLAHPERYTYYCGDIKTLEEFVNMGCQLQLNLLSLTPYYSPETIKLAGILLDRGMYSYAGSDLHSLHQLSRIQSMQTEQKVLNQIQPLLINNASLF